jgi:hypothetical protein
MNDQPGMARDAWNQRALLSSECYVLMPKEPTPEILDAYHQALGKHAVDNGLPFFRRGAGKLTSRQKAKIRYKAMLAAAQPPSAPPEAGKVQDLQSESGIEQLSGYDPWDVGGDDESEPHGPDIEVAHGKECMGCGLVALRDHYESRHPSPVAQGAGVEWISVPPEATAENGLKALLIGEFYEEYQLRDELGGESTQTVAVSWTTIKDIYRRAVAHFAPPKPTAREGGGL